MTTVVADSTVLIYLADLGDLDLLWDLFDQVLVPEAVYEEVVERGREEDYRDALAVKEAANAFLDVHSLSGDVAHHAVRLQKSADLGRGEAEAIALARERNARCLTDDHAARTMAESVGVGIGGTIFVLLEALAAERFPYEGYVSRIDELADGGFRMSASLYRRAIDAGKDLDSD